MNMYAVILLVKTSSQSVLTFLLSTNCNLTMIVEKSLLCVDGVYLFTELFIDKYI